MRSVFKMAEGRIFRIMSLFFSVLLLFGCSTKLTISNRSGVDIELVTWNDAAGKEYYFGGLEVYDPSLGKTTYGILNGNSATEKVAPGSNPILFWIPGTLTRYQTVENASIEKWEKKTFTFYGTTQIKAVPAGAEPASLTVSEIGNTTARIPSGTLSEKQDAVREAARTERSVSVGFDPTE